MINNDLERLTPLMGRPLGISHQALGAMVTAALRPSNTAGGMSPETRRILDDARAERARRRAARRQTPAAPPASTDEALYRRWTAGPSSTPSTDSAYLRAWGDDSQTEPAAGMLDLADDADAGYMAGGDL